MHRPALPELAAVILCAPTSGSALRAASCTTASMSPSGPGTRLQRHHARLHEGIRGRPVRPRLGSSTPGRHCRTPPSGGMSSLRLRALRRRRHHLTPGERSSEGRPPGGFSASVGGTVLGLVNAATASRLRGACQSALNSAASMSLVLGPVTSPRLAASGPPACARSSAFSRLSPLPCKRRPRVPSPDGAPARVDRHCDSSPAFHD